MASNTPSVWVQTQCHAASAQGTSRPLSAHPRPPLSRLGVPNPTHYLL